MATGLLYLNTISIDYPSGRGMQRVDTTVRWTTDGAGVLSFQVVSHLGDTSWYVWNSGTELHLYLNGTDVKSTRISPVGSWPGAITGDPSTGTTRYVTELLEALFAQLGTYSMPQGGRIKLGYGADDASPTSAYPAAFPTWATSSSDQTEVDIPPAEFRPGERLVAGTWQSHNRSAGACERNVAGVWTELKTKIDPPTGDPPERLVSSGWKNQDKLGANAG